MSSQSVPNRAETRLGLTILFILVLIGAAVFYRQFDFNPAVIALRASEKESAESAAHPVASLLPLPANFKPMTPPEIFDPETLFEKINGRADLYLSAGFIQLKTQRFAANEDPAAWLELFIYDMGSALNAFSVYSQQHRQGALPVALGDFAYRVESAFFLAHGPYYIEIVTAGDAAPLEKAARFLAEAFVNRHPLSPTDKTVGGNPAIPSQPAGIGWFPDENLDKNSFRLILHNAFGFDGLDNVFAAEYRIRDIEVTAFVSRRNSAAAAADRARAFHDFLLMFDGRDLETDLPIDGVKLVDIMGTFEVIFSRDAFVAGVHEAPDRETAHKLAMALDRKLKEVEDAR